MCLLTFIPGGELGNPEYLYNGATQNDDGHGFAIVADGSLIIHKGLSKLEVLERFVKTRAKHPEGPALFHSRWTTHGVSTVDNCHPFYVGGDMRTVLAHNGVLPEQAWPKKGDNRSDTRYAAETLIPSLGSLRHGWLRAEIQRWMGLSNKIVILTVNPKYPAQSFILNEAAGDWDGGSWYSNHGYIPWTKNKAAASSWWAITEAEDRWDQPYDEGWLEAEAQNGRRCFECLEEWAQCDCWVPLKERTGRLAKNGYPI